MTAEEYVKHYASGQGGYESVSVDVALRAIRYAKQEMKQQLMAKAKSGIGNNDNYIQFEDDTWIDLDPSMQLKPSFNVEEGEKVKVLVIKED